MGIYRSKHRALQRATSICGYAAITLAVLDIAARFIGLPLLRDPTFSHSQVSDEPPFLLILCAMLLILHSYKGALSRLGTAISLTTIVSVAGLRIGCSLWAHSPFNFAMPFVCRTNFAAPSGYCPFTYLCILVFAAGIIATRARLRLFAQSCGSAILIFGWYVCMVDLAGAPSYDVHFQPLCIGCCVAAAIALLGAGLLFSQGLRGALALLWEADPGGQMLRKLVPVALLLPLLCLVLMVRLNYEGVLHSTPSLVLLGAVLTLLFLSVISASGFRLSQETKKLVKARSDLTLALERLRVALHGGPIVCFNQDNNLRYTWIYNPQRRFPDSIIGKTDIHLFERPDAERLMAMKREVVDTGVSLRGTVDLKHLNEETRHYDMVMEPLRERDGRITGITSAAIDVTELVRARQSAREIGERFEAFLESGVIGMIFCDSQGRINFANDEFLRMVGYGREEFEQSPSLADQITPSAWRAADEKGLEEAYERGRCTPYEKEYFQRGGTTVPVLIGYTLIRERNELVGFVLDISKRKSAEREIEQGKERLRQALQVGQIFVFEWDRETDSMVRVGEAASLFGDRDWTRGSGREFFSLLHRADRDSFLSSLRSLKPSSPNYSLEYRVRRSDGRVYWLSERGCARFDAEGKVIKITGVTQDVTEKKRAEEALRQSEERFRVLAESLPQIVWYGRNDGFFEYFNRRWYQYSGMPRLEKTGWNWRNYIHPQDLPVTVKRWNETIASGDYYEVEHRLKGVGGEYRWFLSRAVPLFDSDGRIARWYGTSTDIHDQKEAMNRSKENEERLRTLSERLSLALSSTGAGVWDWDILNDTVEWSEEYWKLLGLPEDSLMPSFQAWLKNIHPDDRASAEREVREAMTRSKLGPFEHRIVEPGGRIKWIEVVGRVYHDTAGRPIRMVGTCRDISARKRAEEERKGLLESERIARSEAERANRLKDEFVATLSHELRTPLNSILGWAHMLRRGIASSADVNKALEVIERNARSQSRMIEDLLDLSRILSGKIRLSVESFDPAATVLSALESLRPAAEGKGIDLIPEVAQGLVFRGDEARIQQIAWNLVSNAIKFTPSGGNRAL